MYIHFQYVLLPGCIKKVQGKYCNREIWICVNEHDNVRPVFSIERSVGRYVIILCHRNWIHFWNNRPMTSASKPLIKCFSTILWQEVTDKYRSDRKSYQAIFAIFVQQYLQVGITTYYAYDIFGNQFQVLRFRKLQNYLCASVSITLSPFLLSLFS